MIRDDAVRLSYRRHEIWLGGNIAKKKFSKLPIREEKAPSLFILSAIQLEDLKSVIAVVISGRGIVDTKWVKL